MNLIARKRARRAGVAAGALLLAGWYFFDSRSREQASAPESASILPPRDAPVPTPAPKGEATATPVSYQDFLDALTREFPFGRERQGALREMLEGAPPEAVEGLLRLTFGTEVLNDLSHVLIEHLSKLSPEDALAFAREKQFGVDPPWWHSVIGGLADPRVALPDILALPASDVRTNYLGHMTLQTGLTDPDAAMRFALTGTPPEARGAAVANAVFAASRLDYADGFERALLYGSEAGDPGLVKQVVVDWAMDDYAGALERFNAMPEGEARQTALAGVASVAIERDFENAWDMVAQVRDTATRENLYVQAAKRYFLLDTAKAAAWLEQTDTLSAENKAGVRDFAARLDLR